MRRQVITRYIHKYGFQVDVFIYFLRFSSIPTFDMCKQQSSVRKTRETKSATKRNKTIIFHREENKNNHTEKKKDTGRAISQKKRGGGGK